MSFRRKPWDQEEDEAMTSLVQRVGDKHWVLIARKLHEEYGFEARTGKQCRERWHNQLNPMRTRQAWSAEEELALLAGHKLYGTRWSEIAKQLPGRTDNCVKNHFYSLLRRNLRKYNRHRPPSEQVSGPLPDLLENPEMASILLDIDTQGICTKKDYSYLERRSSKRIRNKLTGDTTCEESDTADLLGEEAPTSQLLVTADCEQVDIEAVLDEAWAKPKKKKVAQPLLIPNEPLVLTGWPRAPASSTICRLESVFTYTEEELLALADHAGLESYREDPFLFALTPEY